MKIKITEDQYDKLRFRRRLEDFERFVKESPIYERPCYHANSPKEFIEALKKDVTSELYDTDVPEDFIDFVERYISNMMGDYLIEYYKSKCNKKISESKDDFQKIKNLIKQVGSKYKSDPWIVKTRILDVEKAPGLQNQDYYRIWPEFTINDLDGNFPHIERHLLADFIESMIGLPIHAMSAKIEFKDEVE